MRVCRLLLDLLGLLGLLGRGRGWAWAAGLLGCWGPWAPRRRPRWARSVYRGPWPRTRARARRCYRGPRDRSAGISPARSHAPPLPTLDSAAGLWRARSLASPARAERGRSAPARAARHPATPGAGRCPATGDWHGSAAERCPEPSRSVGELYRRCMPPTPPPSLCLSRGRPTASPRPPGPRAPGRTPLATRPARGRLCMLCRRCAVQALRAGAETGDRARRRRGSVVEEHRRRGRGSEWGDGPGLWGTEGTEGTEADPSKRRVDLLASPGASRRLLPALATANYHQEPGGWRSSSKQACIIAYAACLLGCLHACMLASPWPWPWPCRILHPTRPHATRRREHRTPTLDRTSTRALGRRVRAACNTAVASEYVREYVRACVHVCASVDGRAAPPSPAQPSVL